VIIKRRTKAGKLRYGVRVDRPGGKQEWVGTFATLGEARREQAKALAEMRSPTRMTCDRYAEFWLEGYAERVKGSSYDTAASALRGFMDDYRGVQLARVDRIGAEKWARKNRWRVPMVVTLFNAAVEAELVNRNPFAGLSHKGQGRKRIVPLTVAELDALAEAGRQALGDYGTTMRALILFLAYSGMRPGEVFGLEWTDIDFKRMRISVERRVYRGSLDLPKSNRPRLIVLTPPARDALLALPKDRRLVFTAKRGGRLSQSALSGYWATTIAKADRPGMTPYELRHFAAHHLYVTMGLPARVAAAQLGHDGPKLIEQLYGHGDVGALEEIDAAFENVIPIKSARRQSHGA
jgi:integrase